MAIDLNVVKSINKNGSEITQLKSGDTVIWKKMSVSITETPIAGGKTISFSKTSGDPLQHTFHTRIKATDSYSTSKTSYDVKTVTSGTASGIVAGATITAANTVASKEQAWSVTRATASIAVNTVSQGKTITITNTSGSGTLHYLFSGSTWLTTSDTSITSDPYTSATSGNTAKAYVTGASGFADADISTATTQGWSVTKATAPTIASTPYLEAGVGGKTFTITNNMTGTSKGQLQYRIGPSGTWTNISDGGTTPPVTTATVVYAKVINVTGYADSDSSTDSVTQLAVPTLNSAANYPAMGIANQRTHRIDAPSGSTLYVHWTDGTPASAGASYSTKVANASNLSGTAKAYAVQEGYANSETVSLAWSITKASIKTISVTDIAGGKKATASSDYTGTIKMDTSDSPTTSRSEIPFTTVTNTNVYAKIINVGGYLDSNVYGPTAVEVTRVAAPTVSTPDNNNGGKNFAFSYPSGINTGTFNYTTSFTSDILTGSSSTYYCASTTTQTCNVWLTGVSGYADATSSANNKTGSFTLTLATAPSLTSANITSGKKMALTNNAATGTLQYQKSSNGSSSWSNYADNDTVRKTLTATRFYGRVINVKGYADNVSNPAYIQVDYLVPTVEAETITGNAGKRIKYSGNSASGTLHYVAGTPLNLNSTTTDASKTTSYWTSADAVTYNAWITGSTGYADGSNSAGNRSGSFTLNYNQDITITFPSNENGGRNVSVTKGTADGTLHYTVSGGLTVSEKTTTATTAQTTTNWTNTTVTTCTAWITGTPGYADASSTAGMVLSSSQLEAAAKPTAGTAADYLNSNTTEGGKSVTFTNNATGGTLQVSKDNSNWSNGNILYYTTVVTNTTAYGRVINVPDKANSANATQTVTTKQIKVPVWGTAQSTSNKKYVDATIYNTTTDGTALGGYPTWTISGASSSESVNDTTKRANLTAVGDYTPSIKVYKSGFVSNSATVSSTISVVQASDPTINYNPSTGAIANGRQYTISNNEGSGKLQYKIGTGSWEDYTTAVPVTGNTTIYARVTDVSGETTSPGTASKTVPKLSAPTVKTAGGNNIPTSSNSWVGGKYTEFNTVTTASDGSTGLSTTITVGGGTGAGTRTVNMTTAGSYQPWAYASLNGYATSDTNTTSAVTVYKLDTPTISSGNDGKAIRNGKYTIFSWSGKSLNASNTVIETDLTATWLLWGGTSYTRDQGTASSSSTGEVYVQGVITKQPYAKVCKAGYETSAIKYGTNLQITACTTTKPVISATPISGGKTLSITIPSGTSLCYNWDGDPAPGATDTATAPSVDKTTVSSGTAKAYAYKVGYANVWADNLAWAVTKLSIPELKLATPTDASRTYTLKSQGTDEAGNSGITGCTLSYNWNGTTLNSTATDSIDKTITTVTSGNAYAKVSKNGYVASDTAGPLAWGMEQVSTIADPTSADIDNGKKLTYSAPANCSISVTSVTNGTKSGAVATFTNVASGSATATATRAGYVSRSRTDNVSITQATDPTISHNDNIYNGTTITITAASGSSTNTAGNAATLEYKLDSGNWQTYSSAFQQTGAHTIYVRVKDVSGKYPSPGTTSYTISQLAKPTIGYTVSGQTRTYQISSAASTILVYKWNSTDANYTTSSNNLSNEKLLNTETSGTAYAYARRKGYADSAEAQDLTWGLSKLAAPSITTNDSSYDKLVITFARNNTHGTLRYLTSGSSYSSNDGDKTINITTAGSGTAKAYVEEAGYITSSNATDKTWSVVQLAQPGMTWSSNALNQRTYTISCESGAELCYNWTANSNFTGAGSNSTTKTLKSTDNPQQSGHAYAYARRKGSGSGSTAYLTSATKDLGTWNLPQLTLSITSNMTVANKRTWTVSSNSSGSTLYISWTNGTPASVNTYTSSQEANASNTGNTVKAYATQNGWITSADLNTTWGISVAAAPSVTVDNHSDGGKYFKITNNAGGGTINWSVSGGMSPSSGTGTSTGKYCASTAKQTCTAWMTGVGGYLDGSSSSNAGTNNFTLTNVRPSLTSEDIAGGKKMLLTKNAATSGGTLRYHITGGSWANYADNDTVRKVTTATNWYGRVINVPGYADSISDPEYINVPTAAAPTVTDSGVTQATRNARTYKITNNESTGTLNYSANGSTGTVANNGTVTVTGRNTITAYVSGVTGKANSGNSQQTVPYRTPSVSVQPGSTEGSYFQITGNSASGTLHYTTSGGLTESSDSITAASKDTGTYAGTTQTYCTAWITNSIGYADGASNAGQGANNFKLTQLAQPSWGAVGDITYSTGGVNGQQITATNNAISGSTMTVTGASDVTVSGATATALLTSASTFNVRATVRKPSYATNYKDTGNITVNAATSTKPVISEAAVSGGKTLSCTIPSGTSLCYNWNGNPNTDTSTAPTSNPITTASSGTARAFAYKKGYANVYADAYPWTVTALKAPVWDTTPQSTTGGKYLDVTFYNQDTVGTSVTVSVSISGASSSGDISGQPTKKRAYMTTAGDFRPTITVSANGYASTSVQVTAANKVSVDYLTPDVTVQTGSSTGSFFRITGNSASGTIHYNLSGGLSGTNLTSTAASVDTGVYAGTTKTECTAWITGSTGYADGSSSNGKDYDSFTLTQLAKPTWGTAQNYLSTDKETSGKYRDVTTSTSGATVTITAGITSSDSTANVTNGKRAIITSVATNRTLTAKVTKPGYAENSESTTITVSQLAKPTIGYTASGQTRTYTITSAAGSTLHYKWTSTGSYSYTDDTNTADKYLDSESSGTAYAYAVQTGYVKSETATNLSWSLGYAAAPTVTVDNHTNGGKYFKITNNADGGTINWSVSGGMSPATGTGTSTGNYTGTAQQTCTAWMTGVAGWLNGSSSNAYGTANFTLTRVSAPTVSTPDNDNGGKNFSFSYPSGVSSGTFNYTTSFTSGTKTGSSSTNYCASTTKQTCNVWLTAVPGYADATASANNKASEFTLSSYGAPTLSSTGIQSGKRMTLAKASGYTLGTLQYHTDSTNWQNYSTYYDMTSVDTYYGQIANVKGYANTASSPSSISVIRAVPSVSTSDSSSGGKYFSISRPSGCSDGTINWSVSGGMSPATGTGTNTGNYTGTAQQTCTAWITGATGFADGSSTAGTGTANFTLTATTAPTISDLGVDPVTGRRKYRIQASTGQILETELTNAPYQGSGYYRQVPELTSYYNALNGETFAWKTRAPGYADNTGTITCEVTQAQLLTALSSTPASDTPVILSTPYVTSGGYIYLKNDGSGNFELGTNSSAASTPTEIWIHSECMPSSGWSSGTTGQVQNYLVTRPGTKHYIPVSNGQFIIIDDYLVTSDSSYENSVYKAQFNIDKVVSSTSP